MSVFLISFTVFLIIFITLKGTKLGNAIDRTLSTAENWFAEGSGR